MEFPFDVRSLAGASLALCSVLVLPARVSGDPRPALPDEPTGTLTLADAARAALARSPDLAAAAGSRR